MTVLRKHSRLTTRNKRTHQRETIDQFEIEKLDWGIRFFVLGEQEAYKAAYLYGHSPHGTEVGYSSNLGRWYVTVFNEHAKSLGLAS